MIRNERRKKRMDMLRVVLAACVILLCVVIYRPATAENLLLNRNVATVYAGDQFALAEYVNEQYRDDFSFSWDGSAPSETVAVLTGGGILQTKSVGEVKVLISYLDQKGNTLEETLSVSIVAPEQLSMEYGSSIPLEAVEMYQGIPVTYESDKDSVVISADGILTARGFKKAKIIATKKLNMDAGGNQTASTPEPALKPSGEPAVDTAEPTGEPSGEPTGDTAEPSGEPTGEPSEDMAESKSAGAKEADLESEQTPSPAPEEGGTGTDGNVQTVSFVVAEVTILEPELQKPTAIRAVGTSGYQADIKYFSVTEASESIVWKIADESIATWDQQGMNALMQGTTTADITLTAKNGDQKVLKLQIIITDPKLSESKLVMAEDTSHTLTVTGTDPASEVIWDESEEECAYFKKAGKVYADTEGTATLKVTVDGKEITLTVRVTDPGYDELTVILHKGKTKNLKLSGTVKDSKLDFTSENKGVLTISEQGKMKAKKVGHATIKVNADGRKLSILAEISSKKGYQASKKAISISKKKTKYSQSRRMSKGYYDCSSLVSRVYRQYGVYFGRKSGWSPTAADIGKWCSSHHKVIAKKAVSYKKLVPGDLIFFSSWKNGRFKNITHVEMYTGSDMDVSASSSNNKVIHYGYSKSSSINLIARPVK